MTVNRGNTVTLDCDINFIANLPVTGVYWTYSSTSSAANINVTTINNRQQYSSVDVFTTNLIISNVQIADGGYYKCWATNADGSSESGPLVLTVTDSKSLHYRP